MSASSPRWAAALLAALCLLSTLVSASSASAADARKDRPRAIAAAKAKKVKRAKHAKRVGRRLAKRVTVAGRGRGDLGGGKRDRGPRSPVSGGGATESTAPAGAPDGPAGPQPMFGVFTDDAPYGGNVDAVDALEGRLQRRIDIVNWYQNWGGGEWVQQVQPQVIGAVTGSGRIPLLTWEPFDPAGGAEQDRFALRRIAGGEFDAYIAQWADGLRDTGSEIYLRPMHEMNGNWYPWSGTVNGGSAERYIAAWRRMHDIFVERGATNVRWVWSPMPISVPDVRGNQLEDFYPGERYVDVLALDGYNWGADRPEYGGWQTFREVFKSGYDRLAALGPQPIWLAEVGSAPTGGDKAAWVRDMWDTASRWPRLKALVWFDQDKEEDWRAAPVASAFAQ